MNGFHSTQKFGSNFIPGKKAPDAIFIQVEQAATATGFEFRGLIKPGKENGAYMLAYTQFVMPLVVAVQEQERMLEAFSADLAFQETVIQGLNNKSKVGTVFDQINSSVADGFKMSVNRPNPFTSETVIDYTLPAGTGAAVLTVCDLNGKEFISFQLSANGDSPITITSEKLPPGIYIYAIVANGQTLGSKRMVVAE